MDDIPSFGAWLKRRRKALDLTQEALAQRVVCSVASIRKFESDEQCPSRAMAARIATQLKIPHDQQAAFVQFARQGITTSLPELPLPSSADLPTIPVAEAPAPVSSRSAGNLPARLVSFVGRVREQEDLIALLTRPDVRLLTLTGPGGTGKTSLALQVAAQIAARFPDGVWFVDLSPLSDPELVIPTIAQALDVGERARQPLAEQLAAELCGRRMLLILDNFEQVIGAAAVIGALLRACPLLQILVTSRVILRVRGEHDYLVLPLELPDLQHPSSTDQLLQYAAVALFMQRAQAVRPVLAPTPANVLLAAHICARLDGLPLAIELAAARVRHISLADLLARLQSTGSLDVLGTGPRDQPARQQTVYAIIAWSYGLLAPAEQRLFRRLGVFVGGWDAQIAQQVMQAAEAALGGAPHAEQAFDDQLYALLDSSMVQQRELPNARTHYTMLETLRIYALQQLEAVGELDALRSVYARTYATFASRLFSGTATQVARQTLTAHWAFSELDNLRAVLRWVIDQRANEAVEPVYRLLSSCLLFRGLGREARQWMRELRSAEFIGVERPAFRAYLLGSIGWVSAISGDANTADVVGSEALAIYERGGDQTGIAWICRMLAQAAVLRQDRDRAWALLDRSLEISRSTGEEAGLAFSWLDRGLLYLMEENGQQAEPALQESLRWFRQTEDPHGLLQIPARLVQAALLNNDHLLARKRLSVSLDTEHLEQAEGFSTHAIDVAAHLAVATGHLEQAARFEGFLHGLYERLGSAAFPIVRVVQQRRAARVCAALGNASFEATFKAGQALTLEQAIAEARALTPGLAGER